MSKQVFKATKLTPLTFLPTLRLGLAHIRVLSVERTGMPRDPVTGERQDLIC